ncbi:MAG TPA: type II toxin-antitoxin system HicB family antitoxin [Dehalococcoidia bacterium]|nr:type II toxin-antitoxin system HicB family antitoxin [Dehalococcoidia bacterium]
MTEYALYLESGPKRRKTMVHVPELLGCVATGPTTDETLAATPDAIRAYLRFLQRHGEPLDSEASFTTRIAEHVTKGDWLGNGSPYLVFATDLEPIEQPELETHLRRFDAIREALAAWAEAQGDAQLEATPDVKGRTARAILLHVLGATGAYVAAAVGNTSGFSRIHTLAERGEMALPEALRRTGSMVKQRFLETTPEERSAVIEKSTTIRTLRKALRRTLEHDWEHLVELARRPGGPAL